MLEEHAVEIGVSAKETNSRERDTDFKLEQCAFLIRDEDGTEAENINTHNFESLCLREDSVRKPG